MIDKLFGPTAPKYCQGPDPIFRSMVNPDSLVEPSSQLITTLKGSTARTLRLMGPFKSNVPTVAT